MNEGSSKSYHDQLIALFCSNLPFFADQLGFVPTTVQKNRHIKAGEIDILLWSDLDDLAIVEVKSHHGLVDKFKRKQLHVYHEYDRKAAIYLLVGTPDKSLACDDLDFRRYWPLR